jgi:hypothetical protein
MNRWIAFVLAALLALWQLPAQSQPRAFSQAELDALLAPVALYPDSVLSHILVAATRPEDLRQAAAWSRANSHLSGEQAVQAAEPMPWHPSVKALLAFPDLLARMDESPQWTADLGEAFLEQEPYVMDTIQALRRRAQANGGLQSNEHYAVREHGGAIGVYPAHPHVVYLPYYNPYVVYGPWWWHSYHPVFWRPWHPRPVLIVHPQFHTAKVDWPRRHVIRHGVQRHFFRREPTAPQVTIHNHAHPVRPIIQGARIDPPSLPHRDRRADHRRSHPAVIQHQAPHRDRRADHSPSHPVVIQQQARHVQPLVEGVRSYARPLAHSAASSVQPEQRSQARQAHGASQRRR